MVLAGCIAVINLVDNWLIFLKQSNAVCGFPLVICGIALMFFGWRMWKICVMISFSLIGGMIGAGLAGGSGDQVFYAACGAIILGVGSCWPVNISIALLGGLIGSTIVMYSLGQIGLRGTSLWASGGVAMITCTAFAFQNRQEVVIVITGFFGAILVMSGLTAWIIPYPGIYTTLRGLISSSAIVLPFLLLVPTVMSSFYQSAEVRRLNVTI